MDILLYVLLSTFLVRSCFSQRSIVQNGCSQHEFNRSTCIYELYCVNYIYYNQDYFRHDSFCNDDPVYYMGQRFGTVSLILKDSYGEEIIGNRDQGTVNIISMLDLSSNGYTTFPKFGSMQNLKVLNVSKNLLTEAKLYNANEIPLLLEIDLSYNEIAVIRVERDKYIYRNLKKIYLSHNELEIIEDGIFNYFLDLEHLDLSYNFITNLYVMTFEGIRNLKYFNLKHNNLNGLNNFLFRFNQLVELDLSENNIKEIRYADLEKLSNLKHFDISSNLIMKVDGHIFNNTILLETLNLQNNNLEEIDKDMFVNNSKLKDVNLSKNRLKLLPKDLLKGKDILKFSITDNNLQGSLVKGNFEGIKMVTKLDLSYQQITSVEDYAFYGLENLNSLLLNDNKLQIITKMSFKTLRSLEVLDLSSNQITNIEFDKDDLISLRKLLLEKNHLVQIKNEFFYGLNNLQFLDLSRNNISTLEMNSFKSLKDLVNFQISNNPISGSLEGSTFAGLNSLPRLDISGTLLNMIKNGSFDGMSQLKEFNASHCKISELQYNLFLHTGLIDTIDLSYNELSEFNINTTELINLNRLILNNNQLIKITSSFLSGMPRLVKIIISHNNIETVDEKAFEDQKYIQYLDLSYNKKIKLNISQLEKMQSLINVVLSGVHTNIAFTTNTGMKLTHLEMSESNICNATSVGLNKLKSLENLILSKNNLTKLEASAFNGMQSLKELDLSFNHICFIQPGAFKDNTLLNSLNISHNMLQVVTYGIFRGLQHLSILDMSYNEINDLQSERFYEIPTLNELIVDHNKISHLEVDNFAGISLSKLSIGENPLPCHVLVKLDKVQKSYVVTAIKLVDSSNDENLHGVTCNKDISFVRQHERGQLPAENILLDIRNILNNIYHNKISENSVVPIANDDIATISGMKDQLEKLNSDLNVSNRNATLFYDKLSSSIIESSNNNSLLLSKILKAFDILIADRNKDQISVATAPVEIFEDKKTVHNFMTYMNKMKQDLENTIALEKVNILKEIESKIPAKIPSLDTDRATVMPTVQPIQEAYSNKAIDQNSYSYVFLEVCVGLILVILLAYVLIKVYNSGIFVPNRHSSSTRHLSDVIAL